MVRKEIPCHRGYRDGWTQDTQHWTDEMITVCESRVLTAGVGKHCGHAGPHWEEREQPGLWKAGFIVSKGGVPLGSHRRMWWACLNNHVGWQGTEATTQGWAGTVPGPVIGGSFGQGTLFTGAEQRGPWQWHHSRPSRFPPDLEAAHNSRP